MFKLASVITVVTFVASSLLQTIILKFMSEDMTSSWLMMLTNYLLFISFVAGAILYGVFIVRRRNAIREYRSGEKQREEALIKSES